MSLNGGLITTTCASAFLQALWRKRLRQKFQNTRRRKEASLDVVQEHKSKFGYPKSSTVQPMKMTMSSANAEMYGILRYLPEKPSSEDEESTKRHVQWLKEATKSRKQADNDKVTKLMDLTLYKRREMMVRQNASPAQILEEFPWLRAGPTEIFLEMKRISDIDMEKSMIEFLDKYGNAILRHCHDKKMFDLAEHVHLLEHADTAKDSKYALSCLALMGVFKLLKEDMTLVMGASGCIVPEPETSPVFIVYDGTAEKFTESTTFDLYVDGNKVVECGDFVEVMMAYTSSFYAFNLEHPKLLARTLLFFEKAVLKINYTPDKQLRCERENNKRVIALLSHLNSLKATLHSSSHKKQKH